MLSSPLLLYKPVLTTTACTTRGTQKMSYETTKRPSKVTETEWGSTFFEEKILLYFI